MYKAHQAIDRDFEVLYQHLQSHWSSAQEQYDDIRKNKYDTAVVSRLLILSLATEQNKRNLII